VPLAETDLADLEQLVARCTANVRAGDNSRGAAFFVSNTLLLTSYHVVRDQRDLKIVVEPGDEPIPAELVEPNPGEADDLALLRIGLDESAATQPAVLLDNDLSGGDFLAVGYPAEPGRPTGREPVRVTGRPRNEGGIDAWLQLEAGQIITFGMSGGPVLNRRTGAVVGVVRTSRSPNDALGGGAVPMETVFSHYPELEEFGRNAPIATRTWRDTIGRENWRLLGQTWEMATQVDLSLSGSRNAWRITSAVTSEEGAARTASDLGDDLTEAMFRWAQRRRFSASDEVDLLGRLLAKALFPRAVQSHLAALSAADEITIRLHVREGSGLEDVPWELANIPHQQGFLAADPRYRVIRVDDRTPERRPQPAREKLRVLGVTALAGGGLDLPAAAFGDRHQPWPSAMEIHDQFRLLMRRPGFDFRLLENASAYDLVSALESQPYDVLHYIGVGRTAAGQAQLSTVEPYQAESFQDVCEVLGWARQAGVRLVVLEFAGSAADHRLDPVTLSSLGPAIDGSIEAVVMTRFPVHPRQFTVFNTSFYRKLEGGATLADAVQDGRRRLDVTPFDDDAAGFGCFTVVTGPNSDIRLMVQQVAKPDNAPRRPPGQSEPNLNDPLHQRPQSVDGWAAKS